jgi:sugar/nucleoside kinase (ribokinase family)
MEQARIVGCDTMNFWIERQGPELVQMLRGVDILFLNEGEARQLSGEPNLVQAARLIKAMGPKILVIKKGEHGALLFSAEGVFSAPAYPLEEVCDPTGAGDSFAGGFMGYVSRRGDLSERTIRRAMVYGTVMASFCVERFSVDRLKALTHEEIESRFRALKRITHFEELESPDSAPVFDNRH